MTPKVEVTPQSLVLPLSAGNGPIYTGNCLVRGPDGRPLQLAMESASPGLTVAFPDTSGSAVRVVRITWVPDPGDGRGVTRKTVRLRATSGDESEPIEIPVTCEHK